jgi:parvulin-like peptidyl-prolyl isomerase
MVLKWIKAHGRSTTFSTSFADDSLTRPHSLRLRRHANVSSATRRCWWLCAILIATFGSGPHLAGAEIIDRIVAVVNRQVITLGDVDREVRTQNLEIVGTPQEQTSTQSQRERATKEQAMQRLIDQVLIGQQIEEFPGTKVPERAIDAQLAHLEQKAGSAEAWLLQLKDSGIALEEVRRKIRWQLQVFRFIDYRFRQFIVIDQKEIESYYTTPFSTDLQKRGIGVAPPLAEVEDKIRSILVEQKLNDQVNEWLDSLRASASIQIFH